MLEEIKISYLNFPEKKMLASRFVEILAETQFDFPFFREITDLLKKDIAAVNDSMDVAVPSDITALLLKKDEQRDDAFVAFRDFVKASQKRANPAIQKAAGNIAELIKSHGWTLYRLGYTEQSAKAAALIQNLEKEKYGEALKTLGAESWFEAVVETQNSFEEVYHQKLEDSAENKLPSGLKEKRDNVSNRLIFLSESLRYLDLLRPDKYKNDLQKLNEAIAAVMTTAKARRTRQENNTPQENIPPRGEKNQ